MLFEQLPNLLAGLPFQRTIPADALYVYADALEEAGVDTAENVRLFAARHALARFTAGSHVYVAEHVGAGLCPDAELTVLVGPSDAVAHALGVATPEERKAFLLVLSDKPPLREYWPGQPNGSYIAGARDWRVWAPTLETGMFLRGGVLYLGTLPDGRHAFAH